MASRTRVVYIDDDSDEGYILFRQLKKHGIEVHWYPYTTILESISKMHLKQFDLLIVDVNGTTLKGRIEENFNVEGIETIITSQAKEECRKFKNSKFVCKDMLLAWIINWNKSDG